MELLDDLHPSYDHLVGSEALPEQQHNSIEQVQSKAESSEESQASLGNDRILEKTINQNNDEGLVPPPPPPQISEKAEDKRVFDLDEIANILMQKNIKGNVNCIVEKRRNEELVDHAPMFLNLPSANLPFGLNITTPPRLQHLTGERMIVICKGDEDEEKDTSDEGSNENDKAEELQPIIFPLPNHLLSQVQQIPQIIPLSSILQHIQQQQQPQPVRQIALPQQIPVQQLPVQQIPIQQIPVQQIQLQQVPLQQIQMQPIQVQQAPVHRIPVPHFQPLQQQQIPQQLLIHQQMMAEQQRLQQLQQQQAQQQQQQQQQPIFLPQNIFVPQRPQQNQQNIPVRQEIIPLKEIAINQNRIPVNHVFHHRVPINPMAVNDIPISRMQITHLPMRAEAQTKEEPVPVHHLLPPQAQQFQAENFRQEEPRFNEQPMPFFPRHPNQIRPLPVEVNDPGVLRMPGSIAQEQREQFPMPPRANPMFPNNIDREREPDFVENRAFRPLTVDVRPRGQSREPMLPEISKIIPFNYERRPMDSGRKIRFPDMTDSEEVRENRLPIITQITKIIPIRLEKAESQKPEQQMDETPMNVPQKNEEVPEIKLEKMSPRPFPIPINAILDMIFKGIRPLMGNRGHPFPIPIDIKIERIENKPMGLFDNPFKMIKMEEENSAEEEEEESQPQQAEDKNEQEEEDETEKDGAVEAKVERVEVFNEEQENGHPIPIPADAQDPQVFKLEEQNKKSSQGNDQSSFDEQAFLPNGQGRGARVFPIPQIMKEAEIFSVFDAKVDQAKNAETAEVPVESSMTVSNGENEKVQDGAEQRQGRFMDYPPTPILNFFPISENKAAAKEVKPEPVNFVTPQARSLKLYPVTDSAVKSEEVKPEMPESSVEETRPHWVKEEEEDDDDDDDDDE
ncbi:hypothetical protein RUM44_002869 [Polyplax serrata]|uniref:Uncharacterized protein n=1 Tax=Polyplax serrata TaxID=468196 RepID=A0ABR1AWX6_POLSC